MKHIFLKVFRTGTDQEKLENEKRNKSRQKTIESLAKDPNFKGSKHLLGAGSSPERDTIHGHNNFTSFEKSKGPIGKKHPLMPKRSESSDNLLNINN